MTPFLSSLITRQFLPKKFNALNSKDVKNIIEKLTSHAPSDFKEAREWFALFQELSCAVSQAQTLLELEMHVNSKNSVKKLEEFEKNILSNILDCREKMMDIYLQSPFKYSMHSFENGKISKELLARKKYSKPDLSQLQMLENKIIRDYKNFTHSAQCEFEGKQVLLSAVIGQTHDLNEEKRKNAFFTYWKFVKENERHYQFIFDKLLENRRQQVMVVGCENYTKIAYSELGRFDYAEKESRQLRASIFKKVVPVVTKISEKQIQSLNQSTLLAWNSQVWPQLSPKNPPCAGSFKEFVTLMQKTMAEIHPTFGKLFEHMQKHKLMDILPRPNKAPGAFSVSFQESRETFLFGNFGTNVRDLFTFIHEFGHCLHGYATGQINNILLRQPGFEFCELASQALELLAHKFLEKFWTDPADALAAKKYHLYQMLQFWPFMAMMDEWQDEVYSSTRIVGARERNEIWTTISRKYRPHIDWSGCKEFEELGWLSRPHIYTSPFYFIDYGIAQIGALQLWKSSKQNYSEAVDNYIKGLTLGSQIDLPSLYNQTGVQFDFGEELLEKLSDEIIREITQS